MKKKFVLTLALVLIVAATIVAAPVTLSGEFKAGYTMTFDPFAVAQDNLDGGPSAKTAKLSVAGDFWKVTLDNPNFTNAKDVKATADIYLDKALAEQGVDLGDFGLTLHVGNSVGKALPTVFAKKGYDNSKVEITEGALAGLTVKYSDLATVFVAVDPTVSSNALVGATVNAVDGVSVAAGYATIDNSILGAAKVDVAALADLDFALAVSVQDIFKIDGKVNILDVDVATEIEGIGLWAAYQMDAAKNHNVKAGASYSIEDFGLSASVGLANLAGPITTTIEAGANYALGGVTYALDAKYVVDGAFSLTPSVTIKF